MATINMGGSSMSEILSEKEVNEAMKKQLEDDGPFITLNAELTHEEMKEFRQAIKHYAKENHIALEKISHVNVYKVAKLLNWDKFIYHDKEASNV